MTRDDIIRMAREAGLAQWSEFAQADAFLFAMPDRIERFAALVAAAVVPVCGECGKSAPDLLAALEKCEALALSDNDPEDLLEEVRIAAHSAIALAKGKA